MSLAYFARLLCMISSCICFQKEPWNSDVPSSASQVPNTTADCNTLYCFFVSLFVLRQVSLCSLAVPRTHYVDQAALELTEIHLPPPPKYCVVSHDCRHLYPLAWPRKVFLFEIVTQPHASKSQQYKRLTGKRDDPVKGVLKWGSVMQMSQQSRTEGQTSAKSLHSFSV